MQMRELNRKSLQVLKHKAIQKLAVQAVQTTLLNLQVLDLRVQMLLHVLVLARVQPLEFQAILGRHVGNVEPIDLGVLEHGVANLS
jgi:hypothetical protein